jgi:ABC-type antimicrobial peptide transport system permease subunit
LIVPKSLEQTGVVRVVAPSSAGLAVDQLLTVTVGGAALKGRVAAVYPCEADCPVFADVESAFRLQNIADGTVVVVSTEPLRLRPKRTKVQYDEVLAYPGSVEEVEDMNQRLTALLGNDYAVSPKLLAINNLKRDNARLSAIFVVTVVFAVVFLLLSIGALSKINVDRRRRQMAQLLILGVSRWFVGLLVLCEYFLITALATLFALAVSSLLCTGLRTLLLGGYLGEIPTDASFQRVVNAMEIDPAMFGKLSITVIVCSLLIAMLVARSASRANPIELLD